MEAQAESTRERATQRNRTITTTLLLDADIVAFKFASANQETHDWGDGVVTKSVEDIETIKPQIDSLIAEWKESLKADEVIVCLSCPHEENFRLSILPSYKGNRDYANRPLLLGPVKAYLAEAYRTYARPTLEADDVMGILSTHPKIIPGKKIIVSEDKDMKTIPGWLFNPRKGGKPKLITPEEADYWHLYQALVGDATDNYKGCPGVGPDRAEKSLRALEKPVPVHREITRGPNRGTIKTTWEMGEAEDAWDVVKSWFFSKDLTEEDALVQAQVARICRASDYDFKNKKVKLWQPT